MATWQRTTLTARVASQSHFNDLGALLGVLDPITADPTGGTFPFSDGVTPNLAAYG